LLSRTQDIHSAAERDNKTIADAPAIRQALENILGSETFRTSKRCQSLLRYLVQHSIAGCTELKERTIGTDVFARAESYDPSGDSIVRVTAHDVRRRLQRYYEHEGASDAIRIELQSGSYIPRFTYAASRIRPDEPAPFNRFAGRYLATMGLVGTVIVTGLIATSLFLSGRGHATTPSSVTQFWAPLLSHPEPILLSPAPVRNLLLPEAVRQQAEREMQATATSTVTIAAEQLSGAVLRYQADHATGIGAALALYRLGRLLERSDKAADVALVRQVNYGEITRRPTVLIGAMNNEWTLRAMEGAQVRFEASPEGGQIIDRRDETRRYRGQTNAEGRLVEDYAVVARLLKHPVGRAPIVVIAGISQFGSGVAAEAVTQPDLLKELIAQLDPGWEKKNAACVLRVQIVSASAGTPQVLNCQTW
jgi:hypothetical protein